MDTALATPNSHAAPASALVNLPVKQILMLLFGLLALAAIVVAGINWARTPDYRVLFANLSDRDGGSVVAALSQMNVPYRHTEGGGAILVPANQVHDARLKLASQGLPRGGTVGFELMETQRFGVTQFQERLNFQRGLEGELSRSIQSLSAVQSARVHLALPAQNGFLREQQKPSASLLLAVHSGRTLDRSQVAGIVHLVAASIPELSPKSVNVIDQSGALLSAAGDSGGSGLDPNQLNYIRQVESGYIQRIIDILEPIVGRENVRAQVSADVDFTQSESTAEQFRPNQGNEPAAVRSQQVSEANEKAGAANAQGIPGALSNQPAAQARAPVNGPAQATQAAAQAAGAAAGSGRRDAVTNYEVDKTVRVTRNSTGNIKRVTAAIVVNHRKSVAADGKVSWAALEAAELENINALVREAIGFAKDRGDSINVVNAPFSREELPKEPELPLWKQPET
ncbi:MAG: flagellar M-ring protein FliF, partial [Burkholderiaceae bacterium]|nr:flagellar M-ring protein FliF [Burkholderiaceae bacterium]